MLSASMIPQRLLSSACHRGIDQQEGPEEADPDDQPGDRAREQQQERQPSGAAGSRPVRNRGGQRHHSGGDERADERDLGRVP